MIRRFETALALVACSAVHAAPGLALTLDLPAAARPVAEEVLPLDSTTIATSVWQEEGEAGLIHPEGEVSHAAFRMDGGSLTSLQVLAPIAAQIEASGWDIVLSCADRECGGFDFRHALDILPAPEMHVSLGDFRYLSARKDEEWLAVLVSRAADATHIQVTRVTPPRAGGGAAPDPLAIISRGPTETAKDLGDFATTLEAEGRVVLTDLDFATGSSELGPGPHASLAALADYLAAGPGRRVALVGHTDAEGALEANVALSRRRAQSVANRLVEVYGVDRAAIRAEGMGYLAPLTTNLTPAGREANRRVEVILLSAP